MENVGQFIPESDSNQTPNSPTDKKFGREDSTSMEAKVKSH